MAETILSEDNSNLSTATVSVTRDLGTRDANWLWMIDNGTNQAVDVEFFGGGEEEDAWVSLGTTTVSASDDGFDTLTTDAWEKMKIEATPQSDPTSGTLIIDEMANR